MPTSSDSSPVLIGFDGSDCSREAIARAGQLFGDGRRAVVATVWTSVAQASAAALAAVPGPVVTSAVESMDAAAREAAEQQAEAGADLARAAGFQAEIAVLEGGWHVWPTLVRLADDLGASVVVVGSRGRGTFASALLGSVSNGLVHQSPVPVLVVRPGSGAENT